MAVNETSSAKQIRIQPCRRAFTIVELLVVFAVISVLVALLIPAVQRVRDAALRAHCSSNLRQIGVATHNYHDVHRTFPAGMRFQNGKAAMLMSSWLTHLLPFLEQENLWRRAVEAYAINSYPFNNPPHLGLATPVTIFSCPTDGRVSQVQIAKAQKLAVALTSYLGVEGRNLTTRDGMLFRDSAIRVADVRDGTSTTLFAGERPPSADFQFGWWYAGTGQNFTGSADMFLGVFEENALLIVPGSCGPGAYAYGPGSLYDQCDMFHFWSPHIGGSHFLMADGAVRFVGYDAATSLLALASRDGGDLALDF